MQTDNIDFSKKIIMVKPTFVPWNYEKLYRIFFDHSFSAFCSRKQDQCQNVTKRLHPYFSEFAQKSKPFKPDLRKAFYAAGFGRCKQCIHARTCRRRFPVVRYLSGNGLFRQCFHLGLYFWFKKFQKTKISYPQLYIRIFFC